MLAALLGAPGLGAVEVTSAAAAKKPVVLKTLTKEQIKALPDNDPIDVGGRITTKAQVVADVLRIKRRADGGVAKNGSAALASLQRTMADFASAQKTRIESNNIKALAAVAALRQQVEQQKTDTKPTPCAAPHLASVSAGSGGIYPGMAAFLVGGACFGPQQGGGKLRLAWASDAGGPTPPSRSGTICDGPIPTL